jgi:hypothetical protein
MSDFPTSLSNVQDNVTDAMAKYINNIEALLGIVGSAVTTSHSYKLSGVTGSDKAASLTGVETLQNKGIESPVLSGTGAAAAGTLGYGATDHNLLIGDGTTNLPIHIGHWKSFTPAWGGITEGSGANTGRYCQQGKKVTFWAKFTFAADSSVTGAFTLTLPVAALSALAGGYMPIGIVHFNDAPYGKIWGHILIDGQILVDTSAGAYVSYIEPSSTVPFTWTTGDILYVEGSYEAN